ncbi:DinB family protein [Pararhizobium haloflavum]|uniref:DinB family protein n=1 Tax=Pararhizobium haloflavum TaxID=2037914 RepID=UPI000C1A2331|nr:DinB family protein [Pararhizobium haloflavum]
MKNHFAMFAAYNAWANLRLYDAVGTLSDEEQNRDLSGFFLSIIGTLNHILVADRIWMKRFSGEGDAPLALDTILHEECSALRKARIAEDERIGDWLSALDEQSLGDIFTYVTATDQRTISQPLAPALAHVFNHQTHHRGQVHGMLSQLGRTPPSLDLVYFQRQTGLANT